MVRPSSSISTCQIGGERGVDRRGAMSTALGIDAERTGQTEQLDRGVARGLMDLGPWAMAGIESRRLEGARRW